MARIRCIYYYWSHLYNDIYVCACISVYHCTSDYFWLIPYAETRQLFPVQKPFSKPRAFARASQSSSSLAVLQREVIKRKLQKKQFTVPYRDCPISRPLCHSRLPTAPHRVVSTSPLCLENKHLAFRHFSSSYSQVPWRFRANFYHSTKIYCLCLDRKLWINAFLPHQVVNVVPWHQLWGTNPPALGS